VVFCGERDKLSKDARAALAKWEAGAARWRRTFARMRASISPSTASSASGSRERSR